MFTVTICLLAPLQVLFRKLGYESGEGVSPTYVRSSHRVQIILMYVLSLWCSFRPVARIFGRGVTWMSDVHVCITSRPVS